VAVMGKWCLWAYIPYQTSFNDLWYLTPKDLEVF
jgi:hypothetical protein